MSNDVSVEVLDGGPKPDATNGDLRRSRAALVTKAAAAGGAIAVGGVVVGAFPAIARRPDRLGRRSASSTSCSSSRSSRAPSMRRRSPAER